MSRGVLEAFGILVSRFRVMRTTIELPPATVREVVFTCVVLHNILRSQYQGQPGGQQPGEDDDDDVPGACGLIGGAAGGGQDRNPAREAKRQGDYLRDYFNNEGISGLARWQNISPAAVTSPFQDHQIFQKQLMSYACYRQTPCQT